VAGLVGGVAVASVAAFAATGNVVFGFAPVLVAVVLYAFWVLPLWYSAITFSFVTLVLSNRPVPLPGDGKGQWAPPLYSVFSLLVDNLNTATGIDALRFSGAEVVYVAMVLLVTARVVRGIRIDAAGRLPGANVLYAALAVSFAGVLLLEVEGLARGGDFRQSLWQLRQLLWLPVLTGLFSYCLRDLRDLRTIAGLATLAACVKVALGLFFMVTVAWPSGYAPDVMTGHDDSVLYGSVVACCCAVWVHHPTRRWFVRMLVPCAWVVVGIAVNNRRLAFVSLFASLFVLYVMLQGRMRRQINRGVLLMLPVFALYLLAGRNRRSGIFKPAALVMSVGAQKDASSKTRDIENYNLTQTLKPNKMLGTGWGTSTTRSCRRTTSRRRSPSTATSPTTACSGCSASAASWASRCCGCLSRWACTSRHAATALRAPPPSAWPPPRRSACSSATYCRRGVTWGRRAWGSRCWSPGHSRGSGNSRARPARGRAGSR
jgi:hypothetical protein